MLYEVRNLPFCIIKRHLYLITENIVNLIFSYYRRGQVCISRVEWFISVGIINKILTRVNQWYQKGEFPCLWNKSQTGKIKKSVILVKGIDSSWRLTCSKQVQAHTPCMHLSSVNKAILMAFYKNNDGKLYFWEWQK